ncbi:hypothetical protein [Streptomyces poriticola]|uniref:hypothetical protein n=1 Tax=Streptomyces poriticola TaxID=3120506 RepID=UPI002FCE1B6C
MNQVRLAATASALSLLSLTALTACGGSQDEGASPGGSPKATASTPAPEEKPLTPEQRLAELMVTAADVDGFTVQEPGDEFLFAESPEEVELDRPDCAPLAYAMNQLPLGTPDADLTRVLSGDEGLNGAHTYITLTAYASGEGARSALADVRKAVQSCGEGFTAEAGGNTSAYDTVTAEEATPGGDESIGFASTMSFRGADHTLHTGVVRSGDVVGVYFSVNGLAITKALPSDAKLPTAVVQAQNKKLG